MAGVSRHGHDDSRTRAELVTLVVSIALLVGLVSGVAWLEVGHSDRLTRIDAEPRVEDAYEHGGRWYLPVSIRNVGDRTTDQLVVSVELTTPGKEPEVVDLEFEFVAGGERVAGTAVFGSEPTESNVEAHATAITEP